MDLLSILQFFGVKVGYESIVNCFNRTLIQLENLVSKNEVKIGENVKEIAELNNKNSAMETENDKATHTMEKIREIIIKV